MTQVHDYSIFIGRFQSVHNGHLALAKEALAKGKTAIIVIGSYKRALSPKNPFTCEEREVMIRLALSEEENARTKIIYLRDFLYNDTMWVVALQNKIAEITNHSKDVCLIGYESDSSSYYLRLFPNWKYYNSPTKHIFHATKIRELLFTKDSAYKACVPEGVAFYLENWMKSESFAKLKDQFDFIVDYKEQWRGSPFPPIFVTVDNVVQKSGHILLVRRGKGLGGGALALPGGFLEQDETTLEGAVRELKEETSIAISKEELKKAVVDQRLFDAPNRSERSRTITNAFKIDLGLGELPRVKGSSDADKAFWLPLNEVFTREEEFFEDHFYIIQYFCGQL